MNIQPIESERGYKEKLSKVETLMEKETLNETEESELNSLVDVIEAYENIYYRI